MGLFYDIAVFGCECLPYKQKITLFFLGTITKVAQYQSIDFLQTNSFIFLHNSLGGFNATPKRLLFASFFNSLTAHKNKDFFKELGVVVVQKDWNSG